MLIERLIGSSLFHFCSYSFDMYNISRIVYNCEIDYTISGLNVKVGAISDTNVQHLLFTLKQSLILTCNSYYLRLSNNWS